MLETDEVVAESVKSGDQDMFGELIVRYEEKLKRYARRFFSRTEEVDDLVQDVFIKAYTNIQSFDSKLRFSPWIYRIAHNTFVNELKKKYRYGSSIFDADALFAFIPANETADAETLSEDDKKHVEALLKELSPKLREVIILYYFEELSYQEISDVLQIPTSTVGVRIARARKKLQTLQV